MELSVCQMESAVVVPAEILVHHFTAFLRTADEVTLICPTELAPGNTKKEPGWIALELVGPFEFALTGILIQVAGPLAAVGIAIYALSTFNTDYVLIKADKREMAIEALQKAGHSFIGKV